jgi:ribose transport system ATP-binding protein
MTGPTLLAMQGIALRYGPTLALDGVEFSLRAGEVHALLGENGAGKSSLMQVLAGAVRPTSGTMQLLDTDYAPRSPAEAQQAGVAMVFQELTVLPHLTVAENLWLGRERTKLGLVDRREHAHHARQVLQRLQRGDLPLDQRLGTLSPADRQMVEIARAVLCEAKVLVLDEPTSSLGAEDVRRLFAVLAELRMQGLGIVYISHALEEVREICDRCTVLRDGRTVATGELRDLDDAALVRHMAGRPLDQVFPPAERAAGEAVLEVHALASLPMLRSASFVLRRGEIAGIGGLCGAGRSELLQAIFGLRARTTGSVTLCGTPLPADPQQCWQLGVGLCAEDRKQEGLSLRLSIAVNVVLPRLLPLRWHGLLRWQRATEIAQRLGERVSLRCHSPRQAVQELSGGNQQKVAFARLLHAGCEVLLLDEPTRGIDVGSRQEVYHLLDELARAGAAVLVVSSQLPEVLGLCDRIAVMRRGELGPFRPTGEWTQESLLHEMLRTTSGEAMAEGVSA